MLSIVDLSFSYGEVQALRNISLDVPSATIVSVMGRNGVGKTTLMKNIVGILRSTAGIIQLDGQSIEKTPAHQRILAGIGYVPQGRMIFPKLTVEENLRVGLSGSLKRKLVPDEVLDLFPILRQMCDRMGGDLSGGQQQQLAIGRALVLKPKLLILDEPTEGLQPNIVQEIGDIIVQLNSEADVTVMLVEQKLLFARKVASEFRILEKGRCVVGGAIEELSDDHVREHLAV